MWVLLCSTVSVRAQGLEAASFAMVLSGITSMFVVPILGVTGLFTDAYTGPTLSVVPIPWPEWTGFLRALLPTGIFAGLF